MKKVFRFIFITIAVIIYIVLLFVGIIFYFICKALNYVVKSIFKTKKDLIPIDEWLDYLDSKRKKYNY